MKKISNIQERLKILLDMNHMSANDLSLKLDVNKSLISRYLSGKLTPRQDRIDEIAQFFHVNHAWLMGYDCEMYQDDLKAKIINALENMSRKELVMLLDFISKLKG